MYCKQCHYPLSLLRSPSCPECGRGFDPGDARTFRRYPGRRRLGLKVWLVLLLAVYVGGYSAARWRKLMVREVVRAGYKAGDYVHRIVPGTDLRKHGIGAVKNAIAEPVAMLYAPLRIVEAGVWNWLEEDREER